MSRYIDADALIESVCHTADLGGWIGDTLRQIKRLAVRYINSAPTIDIVRCAECRRVREDGGHANCNGYLYCRKWKTLVDEDSYCSWGERKGE